MEPYLYPSYMPSRRGQGKHLCTFTLKFVLQFCVTFVRKYFVPLVTTHRLTLNMAWQTPWSLHIKRLLLSVRPKFFLQTQLIRAHFCAMYIRYGSGSSWYIQANIRSRINRHCNALDTVKQFIFLNFIITNKCTINIKYISQQFV